MGVVGDDVQLKNGMGTKRAIQYWVLSLAVERDVDPQFDKSLPHVLDGLRAAVQYLGNPRIRPCRASRIPFQQMLARLTFHSCP